MRKIGMAGALVIASFMASAQASVTMQGFWYTEGVEDGAHARFIMENRADGTFIKKISDITDCRNPKNWTETGHWTFNGARLKQITETVAGRIVDATDPNYNDFFDITGDDKHFAMFDPKTQVTWQVDRVSEDFQIPTDCGAV